MKVSLEDFGNALALFEAELIGTFPGSWQKFIGGFAVAAVKPKIDAMLAPFVKDNLVDVDALRTLVDAGMKQSGGQVELPISFGELALLGAKPVTVTITVQDVEKFFRQTIPSVSRQIE